MRSKPVELTPAEWTVIKAVWEMEPCTAPGVHAKLESSTRWSYSTVRTIMDRMAAKRLLRAEKRGKFTVFTSAVTLHQAQQGELRQTLKNAFNGALTPMVQCLLNTGDLSEKDLKELETLIQTRKKAKRQSSPE
jgi:BlaI family penicillinase repressor